MKIRYKLIEEGFLKIIYIILEQKNQDDFINNNVKIIVTTITFGMDINKPNVRYIIHYIIPSSIEEYYREAGRANRDGEYLQCIIPYIYFDVMTNKYFVNKKIYDNSKNENKKLDSLKDYCLTNECLRNFILEYFGEKTTSSFKKCSSCNKAFKEVRNKLRNKMYHQMHK